MKSIVAGALDIAYLETGPADGSPVILLHGFPYDVHSYDEVAELLADAGRRCIVPYLRGYGPTRFLAPETLRSGQQAALAVDLLALMDRLAIPQAVLAGYDWGGRAACIVAALWPQRARGLVSCGSGYNIQNIPASGIPAAPSDEYRYWYQYYFHTERGRAGLAANRREFCRLLWRLWSPTWTFDDATYAVTATSFANPDFVDVVIHSYRHRYDAAPGDPAYQSLEARLAAQPAITVPTIVLHGADDGVDPLRPADRDARHFTGPHERRVLAGIGHDVPREASRAFADGVLAIG
jgi:pimeloyl-ACP methyl ester carboxylesterase